MGECNTLLPRRLLRDLSRWGTKWGLPDIAETVAIFYSGRLSRTFARCYPVYGRIVVRENLARAPYRLLAEVVCHELAHVATYRLHGVRAKPHGKEWQELVRKAGYVPQIRIQGPAAYRKIANRRTSLAFFEHRCPVCQIVRVARRPVASWRCADCLDAGLEGAMVITRKVGQKGSNRGH